MAITKFASFEVSEVLDVKGSPTQAKTASLDKLSDFNDFRTEDGYMYVRIRAISSRVNKNNDGWPSVELAGGRDAWDKYHSTREARTGSFVVEADRDSRPTYGFGTFLGKPIFVDHHNSDPNRARGVIVDAKLHVEDQQRISSLDPYYATAPDNHKPPTWVELLLEVDAHSFPHLAKAIKEGAEDGSNGIDGFSMGCDVDYTVCNICKNTAYSPKDYCDHILMKGATFNDFTAGLGRTSKRSYEDCYGIKFFEISAVFDPADETALTRELIDNIHKEGAQFVGPDMHEPYDPRHVQRPAVGLPLYDLPDGNTGDLSHGFLQTEDEDMEDMRWNNRNQQLDQRQQLLLQQQQEEEARRQRQQILRQQYQESPDDYYERKLVQGSADAIGDREAAEHKEGWTQWDLEQAHAPAEYRHYRDLHGENVRLPGNLVRKRTADPETLTITERLQPAEVRNTVDSVDTVYPSGKVFYQPAIEGVVVA